MSECDSVNLLWALYPCTGWFSDPHGATVECECEEYLEGVFASVEGAKAYIPESLDERDDNLEWKEGPLNKTELYADAGHGNLHYVIQGHSVSA